MTMLFEWDEAKRQANLTKHLIDFADATRIFGWPVFEKAQRRHGEERTLAVGLLEDVEVVVVYVTRATTAGSSQPGRHIAMKGKNIKAPQRTRPKGATDLKQLRAFARYRHRLRRYS